MDRIRAQIKKAKEGDRVAKEKLILENTGLVWSVVKGFQNRGYDKEDLFQIGCIGLIKSIERFDLEYDVKFSTYAVPVIMGEIRRFLRDDGMIRVSRKRKEDAYKISQAMMHLSQKLGRDPELREISSYTEMKTEEILLAMEAVLEVDSLNRIITDEGKEVAVLDKLPSKENLEETIIENLTLDQALNELNEKERTLIRMRYYEDKTQTEVSKTFGVSQVQISRMERKILYKLREHFK